MGPYPRPGHTGGGADPVPGRGDGGRTLWAVGAFRNDRPEAGWVAGDTWHWTHPIDPGLEEDQFLGVAAAPDGTVWAVGKHQDGANYQPLIERYDGTAWSVVASPTVGARPS